MPCNGVVVHSDDGYGVYTKLRIDPLTGAVTSELPYQYIPGITPQPPEMVVIPQDFYAEGRDTGSVRATLEGLGFVVVEQTEPNEMWVAETVIRVECNGVTVISGQELEKGAVITMVVSSGSAQGGDPIIPGDPTVPAT